MADVGHARTNEDLLNGVSSHFAQQLHIVGIVGAGQNRFGEFIEIDLKDLGVFRIGIRLKKLGIRQPVLHRFHPSREGSRIAVAPRDHVLEQGHIAA